MTNNNNNSNDNNNNDNDNNNNNNNNKYLYSAYPRALSALQINTGFNSLSVLESRLERLTCYGAKWQPIIRSRSSLS